MCKESIRLAVYSKEIVNQYSNELGAYGIKLYKAATEEKLDGFLLTTKSDCKLLAERLPLPVGESESESPTLILVYGADVPYDMANMLRTQLEDKKQIEVVRMALLTYERVLLGGDPNSRWVRFFCRLLAEHSFVSMVCGMREVDEALRQLPRYLAWKERFYIELGEECDQNNVSVQQVTRALGMNPRIGQGWIYPLRQNFSRISTWIENECRAVLQNTNIHRIVLWGDYALWQQMDAGWLAGKDVIVYVGEDKPFPNEETTRWNMCTTWQEAVKDADLLVIGSSEGTPIQELPLHELVRGMRMSYVIDAAACFPVQEAQSYSQGYRAIGEKTNVWE